MNKLSCGTGFLSAFFLTSMVVAETSVGLGWPSFDPPRARPSESEAVVWHGERVPDPYRWLEDTGTAESVGWIEGQAAAARAFLDQLPDRASFQQRLEALQSYDKHGVPAVYGGRLFYARKTGLQNQAVHYWAEDKPGAEEVVLLDPNVLAADGTVAIAGLAVSPDGRWAAYGVAEAGSDWQTWRVREVSTGRTLADELRWVKFSGASWAADSSGFYYSRYAEPAAGEALKVANANHQVYFHRVGTPQVDDRLVYERPDQPRWLLSAGETEDGRYVVLSMSAGAAGRNAVWVAPTAPAGLGAFRPLRDGFEARYDFVGNEGGTFYFLTDHEAPRGRLVAVDLARPEPGAWRTILPETDAVLQSVQWIGGRFLAQRLVDAHEEAHIHEADGARVGSIELPNMATISGLSGRQTDREVFYAISGYTQPAEIFRYEVASGARTLWKKTEVPFAVDQYVTTQQFATSADGTKIPMFVTQRRGLPRDGGNPTILYGYGGFNISLGPAFSPSLVAWLERGGVSVVANLRGGGEYGEAWHQAGQRLQKQRVFDDFVACAQEVVASGLTAPERLAISGGSNGGLLVAACLQQRPELFAAAAPAVGVHDLLRFHLFTIGWAWQDEYGFPEKEAADFHNLRRLSPYHNVIPGRRVPPTLIMTADHDDRVFPAHSYKLAAAMQAAQTPEQRASVPVVLRVETRAGHGAGTPTSKSIALEADRYAFFAKALGMKP